MTNAPQIGRLSGIAFTVGAGIAIATASAASAWASPADSTTEAPAKSTVQRAHPSAASTAPGRNTVRPAAAQRASKNGRTPAVAPTASTAPDPAAAAPIAPVAAAAATPAVASAVTAIPAATQQAAASVTGLFQRQRTITILPKIPPGLPLTMKPWVKKVTGSATFTDRSVYDLHSVDQYDWNKLSGISFAIPGDVNSTMVAWRYNVDSGNFEIAPFFNVDRARILPVPSEVITVPIGQSFDFAVDYNGITISYGDQTVYKATPAGLTPNFWTSYRTSVWFGGTSLPPKVIKLKLRVRS